MPATEAQGVSSDYSVRTVLGTQHADKRSGSRGPSAASRASGAHRLQSRQLRLGKISRRGLPTAEPGSPAAGPLPQVAQGVVRSGGRRALCAQNCPPRSTRCVRATPAAQKPHRIAFDCRRHDTRARATRGAGTCSATASVSLSSEQCLLFSRVPVNARSGVQPSFEVEPMRIDRVQSPILNEKGLFRPRSTPEKLVLIILLTIYVGSESA